MRKVFIYVLIDPRKPDVVRYVGQTMTPTTRHIQHCCESGQSGKCAWIEEMRLEGVMPQMEVIAETNEQEADARERLWIARLMVGSLTNREATKPAKPKPETAPEQRQTLQTLNDTERDLILATLKACGGNKLETSRRLGIGRQTLYNKLKAYGVMEE
jgi:DNA-binding NtrC family response regulator